MVPAVLNGKSIARPANRLSSLLQPAFDLEQATLGLWDDGDAVTVEMELPGVDPQDVDCSVQNGVLTVRAERRQSKGRRLYGRQTFGRFEQSVKLPPYLQVDSAEAKLTNGILTVTLPKRPESKPQKIVIT